MIEPQVFKANDLRGLVRGEHPEWDADGARAIGAAFARALDLAGQEFVLGRDMRAGGRELSRAFAEGAMRLGANPVEVGLVSTDELWYASGATGLAGVQFTASHNPSAYNGIKFCLPQAAPITPELMARIKQLSFTGLPSAPIPGTPRQADMLAGYVAHLHGLVDLSGIRPLRVVVDAGNGMAGLITPAVFAGLPVEVIGLYLDLDGDFPNHPPNPLEPANLVDAQAAVREHRADLGLVFDGDADRCFIIDQAGEVVSPSVLTALIARAELAREPGAVVVVNTITSTGVAEVIEEAGGRLVVGPVGHTHLKALMGRYHAIFGGEHSGHYYFRELWGADSGMLAALHVLSLVGHGAEPMSALARTVPHYPGSGELNAAVADPQAVMRQVAAEFAGEGAVSYEDGLMVRGDGWWVSVRASNTEPLLRLNVEAGDIGTMTRMRDRALAIIEESND
ncbi:MAG: phosphomannomutase/phosphoglucomutase [Propionicimonas sp.]|uniref:phosphomannomutase/phosphoglucomutase n=1 Tax=Propionicimonas sp. TaxID=1955623 RepID=UPI002B207DA3|nr:phosphomannomutase/phosphoglucomutase [Propionicimonas sp.]MEA4943595.1 phosphomannomutase/phosphoglucomutase [Propionicimonas sp.]